MEAATIQAIAGVATFLAACMAVWATLRAPRLAAEFAEKLRADALRAEEARRQKFYIFATLMQYRTQIMNSDAVAALNLIDLAYRDSRDVRLAWKYFHAATLETPSSPERIIERFNAIIEKMAKDLGLGDQITVEDIKTTYYPTGLGQVHEAGMLEVWDKLERLRPKPGDGSAIT